MKFFFNFFVVVVFLLIAIAANAAECKDVLLSIREGDLADLQYELEQEGSCKEYGLIESARNGKLDYVKHLVEEIGVDINTPSQSSTPLIVACGWTKKEKNAVDLSVVKYLLKKGADINVKRSRHSPLANAVSSGCKELVRLLIKKGVNIRQKVGGKRPLVLAAEIENYHIIEVLLQHLKIR